MKKGRRSGKNKAGKSNDTYSASSNDEKLYPGKMTPPLKKESLLIAATVVGIAYLIAIGYQEPASTITGTGASPVDRSLFFQRSTAANVLKRLSDEWPSGNLVTIIAVDEASDIQERGLFAKTNIQKGVVVAAVEYEDIAEKISRHHPTLKSMVETAVNKVVKERGASLSNISSAKILAVLQFLLEVDMGEGSTWISYIESLPKNVSNMAWYWTEEERKCVVPRPDSESVHQDLQVFHGTMEYLKDKFPPLERIYDKEKLEWAYLMLKTRGFGPFFLPVMDMANHNPLKAAPVFIAGSTAYNVATGDIRAGEQIYANYGPLSTVALAERYGFLDETAAYFEVPSISEHLLEAERTRNEPLCTSDPMTFFGNVTEKVVSANLGNKMHNTYFKPYMPSELAYACIRVLLQTERDTDIADYIAGKLQFDFQRYKAMAEASHCQSNEGNFPLIRNSNQIMVELLWGALQVAEKGRNWEIAYPDIPTYIKNYPEH